MTYGTVTSLTLKTSQRDKEMDIRIDSRIAVYVDMLELRQRLVEYLLCRKTDFSVNYMPIINYEEDTHWGPT